MDEFRIGSLGFVDSHTDQRKDGSKKRPRHKDAEPQEDPTDQVTLSSAGDAEEPPSGYLPASPDQPPK
jgi:hypothetical protein